MSNNYIWIFGENHGNTTNNNSYYFWKKVVNIKDDIDKYIVLVKNKQNKKTYKKLSNYEKKFVLWKNSLKHYEKYFDADMLFVTLSYLDVAPSKFFFYNLPMKIKKPVIYLQHGTLAMKKIEYTGASYTNNMFRFCIYNNQIKEKFMVANRFKEYQMYYSPYHPRYTELLRREDNIKNKKQIFWFITWREYFGNNPATKKFVSTIKQVVNSKMLKKYLEENNIEFKIGIHSFFKEEVLEDIHYAIRSKNISIVFQQKTDIMDEIAKSKLLITDYSSLGFDFTFLNKPVILFQSDREEYLKKRKIYCTIDELEQNSVKSLNILIKKIINEDYGINNFFRSKLEENIDYEYVRQGKHIDKMYEDFSNIQRNKITFMGYNFYGVGGTVNATRALAEGLLEEGYMVELLSLVKSCKPKNVPYGATVTHIYFRKTKSIRERVIRKFYRFKKNYSYLKWDPSIKYIHPYCGYYLTKIMKNIKTHTLVSTRESLHLFLNDCISEKVKNKIYFFHTPNNVVESLYPGVLDKVNRNRIGKAAFVTELNRLALKEENKYENYEEYVVTGNALEQYKIINPEKIKAVTEKEIYKGIYMLRISEDRIGDIDNLIEFGIYLKERNVENFILDVFGTGDYVKEFKEKLEEYELKDIIKYRGLTNEPIKEIRKHDVMIDLSESHSFGMIYIEAILNGKKVFCMKNPGSLEVLEDIPNSYIESYDDLYKKINSLNQITQEELVENYNKIQEKYSRKLITEKFMKIID